MTEASVLAEHPSPRPSPSGRGGLAVAALLVLLLTLLLAACTAPVVPTATVAAPSTTRVVALRGDGRPVELTLETIVAFGAVTREDALTAAREGLPSSMPTSSSRVSLTLLTVGGGEDGTVTLHRRPVWLVTFPEAQFVAGDVCACEGAPARPATLVAVDAADGALLASFGVDA